MQFDIELPDKRVVTIEAADEATAVRGAQEWSAANPLQTDVATDVAKSSGIGLAKGAIGMAGLPGDIGSLVSMGLEKLGVPEVARKAGASVVKAIPGASAFTGPGSADIQKTVEGFTGQFYKPQTTVGKFAETVGEFAPAALAGPGGIARRAVTQAVIPGLASEAAGQATQGTAWEPAARIGGALLAGPAAVSGADKIARAVGRETSPTVAALRSRADQLYKEADNSGVIIHKNSIKNAVDDIKNTIAKEGVDATLHPNSIAAYKRLEAATQEHQSLKGAEILRRVVSDAAQSGTTADRRIARIIRDKLDDFTENLTGKDVFGQDPKAAVTALSEARSIWGRVRKAETIERLVERAKNRAQQFTGSGYENALRTEFRQLAQNEKRMGRFSKAEQSAIQNVARGGPVNNVFRMLGRLAPRGPVGAGISGGSAFAAGSAFGGPVMGAATVAGLFGLGELGRLGATIGTKANVRDVSNLVRGGVGSGLTPDNRNLAHLLMLARAPQQGLEPQR